MNASPEMILENPRGGTSRLEAGNKKKKKKKAGQSVPKGIFAANEDKAIVLIAHIGLGNTPWATGTVRWMRSNVRTMRLKASIDAIRNMNDVWTRLQPKALGSHIREMVTTRERLNKNMRNKTYEVYREFKFHKFRLTKQRTGSFPGFNWGITLIIRARINALWFAAKLAKLNLIHRKYENLCPSCQNPVPETLSHAMVSCLRWRDLDVWSLSEMRLCRI